jgi:hypothetical protein
MALVLKDRVKETTTTTGTGAITLAGAATGFQSFAAVGNANTTYYAIQDSTAGTWEVGIGTYTASGTTLSRDTVLSSSNSGSLVNFGAGSKDVFVTYPSEFSSTAQVGDLALATTAPTGPGTWLETGKYYSKAAYPELAAAIGSVADLGTPVTVPQAQLPKQFTAVGTAGFAYNTATDGTVTVAIGVSGAIRTTTDGVNWVGVPSTTTAALNEIRYINSNFVVVGNAGVFSSTNGTTWVSRASVAATNLNSVAFGAGRYVAVGNSGAVIQSTDLVTWNIVFGIPTNFNFLRVIFANSLFVAVGGTGACWTSPDGVTWTNSSFTTTALQDVVFGNSVFVATTNNGQPWYSTDGLAWASSVGTFSTNSNGLNPYITASNGTTTVVVGTSGAIRRTTDGSTWSAVNANTTSILLEARFLNSNYVAVGAAGAITTSADGTTWTARNSTVSSNLNSVAFGASRYVAVGAGGTVVYSSDLVTWTLATGTGATVFNRVIFANSLFVAVGASGALFTSPDGITWTTRSAGSTNFNDVIFANSQFVALGNAGAAYTSPDGITWTSRSLGDTIVQVIYANSLYVAVGGTSIWTSSDAVTWTLRATIYFGGLSSVVWNGSAFYAVSNSQGGFATSSDGITWTTGQDATYSSFYSVAVVNGRTIAFGSSACVILAGAARAEVLVSGTWNYAVTAQNAPNPRTIAYNGTNQYIAVGSSGSILSSTDGANWTAQVAGSSSFSFDKVQYMNGNYLAMGGSGGNSLYTSSNGATWTARTSVGALSNAAAFGAGVYVVVGVGGSVYSSSDVATWTLRTAGSTTFNDVIFANSLFVAVGNNGTVYTSPDGITWTAQSAGGSSFFRVIYANSLFVAVGSITIYTSPDGVTWTSRASPVSSQFNDVTWNGSVFVAVGSSGGITSSPDGITWTARAAPASNFLTSISWSGSQFVVTNTTDSSIFVSSNGFTWRSIPTIYTGNFLYSTYAGGRFLAVGSNKIITSTNGTTWTSAANVELTSVGQTTTNLVAFTNNRFFLLGTGAATNMATSTDGINWTNYMLFNPPGAVILYSAIWNGTSFVIVGNNGNYFTSTDAATWTGNLDASMSPFFAVSVISGRTIALGTTACVIIAGATRAEVLQSTNWNYTVAAQSVGNARTIAYNGTNQYVAVGSNGAILSSADGQSWVGRYSGTTLNFDKVQHLNGNYLAMGPGSYGNNLYTSSNGTSWTPQIAGAVVLNAAAFGAGVYVVVSSDVFSSSNLVDWTRRTGGSTLNDVVFANSLFVAVGNAGFVTTSPDGITWTSRTAGSTTFNRIIYANSLFVAIGNGGTIYTSSDGITWTLRASGVSAQLNDVVWSGSQFCAVGNSGVITTSPNGLAWTARTPGDTGPALNSISWSGTRFVVTNTTNGVVWHSTDGITWTRASTVFNGGVFYSAYLGGRFLLAGANQIQTSTDGLNWTCADPVQYVPAIVNKIYRFGSSYYVATSKGIYQSTDGINFTLGGRSLPSGAVLSIAYSGSVLLAVSSAVAGQPMAIYRSTNGTTWSKCADLGTLTTTSTIPGAAIDLVYANGNFILGTTTTPAQGLGTTIYTSTDGVTWTGRLTPALALPSAAMATDGTTTVFGSNIGTLRSTDGGVSWAIINTVSAATAIYDNGVWIFSTINNFTVSTDLSTFYFTGITASAQVATQYYVSGNYVVGVIASNAVYFNKNASGYIALPLKNNWLVTYAGTNKEIPVRGTTGFLPNTVSQAFAPNPITEIPLYSYDTATTFWIPPSNAGAGQQAYIYAGA